MIPCDEDWKFIPNSPDKVDLLEEKEHTPGILTGYYIDDEYPFLICRVLELLKERFPSLDKKPINC